MARKRYRRQIDLMNRIRMLRQRAKLTQGELAEQVGIDQAYLSRIERARRPGSIAVLERIAEALGVGISDLFERDGREQLFMALLDELRPEQKEQALVMLETFVRALKAHEK